MLPVGHKERQRQDILDYKYKVAGRFVRAAR